MTASPGSIPYMDWGGTGQTLVFLHANGYPPRCYAPLLGSLSKRYRTAAMLFRPLWKDSEPEDVASWHVFSEDLLKLLDQQNWNTVIAVGHSMGATTALRAALAQPTRFAALVLLDPVLLPRLVMAEWRLTRALGLGSQLHPLIRGAIKRRRSFASLGEIFDRYRRRPVFRYMSDEHLRALIEGVVEQVPGGGYALTYSPEWEARIYDTGIWDDWDLWAGLPGLKVPTLIIRGAQTDTFRAGTARAVQRTCPGVKIVSLPESSHLLPLERPAAIAELIEQFLSGAAIADRS